MFSMSDSSTLSNCTVRVWRGDWSRRFIELKDVEICFESGSDRILIKEFPELCSSSSFVAYEVASCTLLAPRNLAADAELLCLQLNESTTATAHVTTSTDSSVIKDELTTLEMCCGMSNTKLQAGWIVEITIPHHTKSKDSISNLIQILRENAPREDVHTDSEQSATIDTKVTSVMDTLTLSDEDFSQLEHKASGQTTSAESHNNPLDHKVALNKDARCRTRKASHFKRRPAPTPRTGADVEREEVMRKNWDESQEMWAGINGSKAKQDLASGPTRFDTNGRAFRRRVTETLQPPKPYPVPDPRTTGGYLQDPHRDYTKVDGPYVTSPQHIHERSSKRARRIRSPASFIPRTNTTAVPSPSRRVRTLSSVVYKPYDAEEEDGEAE